MKFTFLFFLIFGEFYLETPPPEVNSKLSNVNSFLQDKDGFLWMSSQVGLFRYDGYELVSYSNDPNDPNSIPANWLTDIDIDQDGNLWIATFDAGLCRYDQDRNAFTQFLPPEIENRGIGRVLLTDDGSIWLGFESGGLGRFDPESETFTRYQDASRSREERSTVGVGALFKDNQGRVWIGNTNGRIDVYNPIDGSFQTATLPQASIETIAWDGLQSDDGTIWVATSTGLFQVNPDNLELTMVLDQNQDGERLFAKSVLEDSKGRLWVGTLASGAFLLESGKDPVWLDYRSGEQGSLPYKRINCFFEDRTNVVWISTLVGGISKYDPKAPNFHVIRRGNETRQGLSDGYVKAIYQDESNRFWIGGNQGLDYWDLERGLLKSYSHNPNDARSLSNNQIRTITPDERGYLWVGTYGGGLNRLNPDSGVTVRYENNEADDKGIHSNWIEAAYITEDKKYLWIGTNIGLERLDFITDQFELIPMAFSQGATFRVRIRTITEPEPGYLYLGSNFGLTILDVDSLRAEYFNHDPENVNSLPNNIVRAIYPDSRGNIWIGTSNGLSRFERADQSFKNYDHRYGLANNVIYCIEEDEQGFLWVSTNRGLSRFDVSGESFFNYFVDDGLQGSEFNGGASLRTRDGTLFFGGINGINWFRSDTMLNNPYQPQIALSKVLVSGEPIHFRSRVNQKGVLELEPEENFLQFEFTALDFSDPTKNRYRYKLEGLEETWSPANERHFATYTNLSSGNYTFKVKASNNEGVWNMEGYAIPIEIRTPFFKTLWFYLLCIGVLAALIIDRMRMLTVRGNLLEETVKERTSSLEDINLKLQESNNALQHTQDQLVQAAHEAGMTEVLNGVVHNLGNILNSVGVTLESLTKRVENSRLANVKRISELLKDHEDNLSDFLEKHERGRNLVPFTSKLADILERESVHNKNDLNRLSSGFNMLRDTIRLQQGYAGGTNFMEKVHLSEVVEDMLRLQQGALDKLSIRVKTSYNEVPHVLVQRHRLAHVITNLLKNAIDALRETEPDRRTIWITIAPHKEDHQVEMNITDNGMGIQPAHLDQVFQYGFTTKKSGKGFGLHSCANSMTEMGGQLTVESEGLGQGARFILLFNADVTQEILN